MVSLLPESLIPLVNPGCREKFSAALRSEHHGVDPGLQSGCLARKSRAPQVTNQVTLEENNVGLPKDPAQQKRH
jgi:hypothetical protein